MPLIRWIFPFLINAAGTKTQASPFERFNYISLAQIVL